jgi:hypothetical protein
MNLNERPNMTQDTAAYLIDRSLYHEGRVGTMTRTIRRYRDRPAIEQGTEVTIQRLTFQDDGYGPLPRVLVSSAAGERWISPTDVEWHGQPLEIRGW